MNLFQLVLKQMRQRSLTTTLTLLSVLLGVALAVSILIISREGANVFGQSDYGYDIIIGSSKGSPLQLVLNTVYHIDKSAGAIPYLMYENLTRSTIFRRMVKIAVPYAVGDSYKDHRIVGTTPRIFNRDDDANPITYIKYTKKTATHEEGDTAALPPDQADAILKSGDAEIDPDGYFQYRPSRQYEFAQGRPFVADKFEAVIGADVPRETGLKLGDQFQATHGLPRPGETPDIHKPKWTVVGVLTPTHTANDRVLLIPLTSFYTIAEHDVGLVGIDAARRGEDPNLAVKEFLKGLKENAATNPATTAAANDEDEKEHYTVDPQGRIHLDLPKEIWGVNAILIKSRGGASAMQLLYMIQNSPQGVIAVNPASSMRVFFDTFLKGPTQILLLIALLVTIVAGVGILVSIYNSVSARLRGIAILRALGATRVKILTLICSEAALIGLIGGVLGLVTGHLVAALGSAYLNRFMGEGIDWVSVGRQEWLYLLIVIVIAVLAGLVPALKAYRTPVATNLVAA